MDYYIEPAEQTDEVKAQLAAITPSTLDPETLTLIDPACGSGHILVEAYDLLKAIYLERGYRLRDITRLILEKNLFGLDIDGRAAQLTGFALMMKGRADDRRLFERGVTLNVMAFVDSTGFDAKRLAQGVKLVDYGLHLDDLTELKQRFEHATTFGSLIQIPEKLATKLPALKQLNAATSRDLFESRTPEQLELLVRQAELLAAQYDAVVANPPYMGGKGMNVRLKKFAKDHFPDAKSDLFACFIKRGYTLAKDAGYNAMVTMESWMFLSSYEKFRNTVLHQHTLRNLAHFPYDGKRPTAMGINFGVAVASAQNTYVAGYQGHYCCSRHYELNDNGVPFTFPTPNERLKTVATDEFKKIPGSPVAYWVSKQFRQAFYDGTALKDYAEIKHGLSTGKNEAVVRTWPEVSAIELGLEYGTRKDALSSGKKWFPYNKGGNFRKWYGNCEFVLRYDKYGNELMSSFSGHRHDGKSYYFLEGVTWTFISSSSFAARHTPLGFVFDVAGSSLFCDKPKSIVAFLSSGLCFQFLRTLNPTLNFQVGNLKSLPIVRKALTNDAGRVGALAEVACSVTREDWDTYERSWDFQSLPILAASSLATPTLEAGYAAWIAQNRETIAEMKRLEEENNRLFIDAYGLTNELTPEVPIEQITLTVNPAYRYGGKLLEEEQWTRFRQDTMAELVSYAIGCMMGRYSLDEPGLIYAHSGSAGFDSARYTTFPADSDGIIPLTQNEWFEDDAANRLIKFISVAWDAGHLDDNLTFLASNLSPKKNESSGETLRRYLCDSFFKDHLQTYKRRPIYWLFSSGKQKAFQCLVYLHRYNEGTLARMRTEYVIPLQGKMASRVRQLEDDIDAATSTPHRRGLEKERATLAKQQAELREFDEKLRHYADQRISLDLDDGVKVNYGKFGDLLAEVKTVTGGKAV